jgi:hypothetical protein
MNVSALDQPNVRQPWPANERPQAELGHRFATMAAKRPVRSQTADRSVTMADKRAAAARPRPLFRNHGW